MVAIRLVYSHISIRWYKFRPYYYYGCRLQRESHLQELLSVNWPNARMAIKDPEENSGWAPQRWKWWPPYRTSATIPCRLGWERPGPFAALLHFLQDLHQPFPGTLLSITSPLTRLFRSPAFRSTLNIDIEIFAFRLQALSISPPPSDFVHWFNSHRKGNTFWENWQK